MVAAKGNKYALGLTTSGRPPIYSPEDEEEKQVMYNRIIEYFDYIKGETKQEDTGQVDKEGEAIFEEIIVRHPESLTITGLALFLGFSSKGTLYEYAKKKEFSDSIKRALLFVEQHYEEMLLSKASTGAIFALKNMDWKDKAEVENTNKNIDITPTKEELKQISEDLESEC